MRKWLLEFARTPELVDDSRLRLGGAALLAAGGVFFFRAAAVPPMAGALAGGALVLALLWGGFRRLGLRPLGAFWPGATRGLATTLLVACLLPPGMPAALAAALAALAVLIEAVERRAIVPLAASGVTAAWLLAWAWQARTGLHFAAPFDLHSLDEPVTLWVRFGTAIDPVRTYAGQVAGPLGATSFGLVALVVLVLSYSRSVSWHLVAGFVVPVALACLVARLPFNVYLIDAPALLFVAVIAAESRRLPRAAPWRVATGAGAGVLAGILLAMGWGYQAFGVGVATATAVVSVFQFSGLAGSPGVLRHRREEPAATPAATVREHPPPGRGRPALEVLALAAFTPLGLWLVLRDESLERSQRQALVAMGLLLYAATVAGSLAWLWLLRVPA